MKSDPSFRTLHKLLRGVLFVADCHNGANHAVRRRSPARSRNRMLIRRLPVRLLPAVPNPESNVKRLYNAFFNTLRGFSYCLVHEAAVREETVLLVIALPLAFFLAPGVGWYVAMIGSLLAVLAVELLNTSVEKLADHITRDWNVEIRRVKDFGSAAVFCALCFCGLIWLAAIALRFGLL
jgi:diacylglycerol kinase (ATP)